VVSFSSIFFYLSLFSSPNLSRHRLDVCHTSTHHAALVRIYDAGLKRATSGSLKIQDAKTAKNRRLGTIAQLCRAISLQLRYVPTTRKSLLKSNISPACLYNTVNFDVLGAEILSLVWGTPAIFNGFRVLDSLL